MDDEALRIRMNRSTPFNALIGVEVTELGSGRGVARLPGAPGLANHVGTHHATVIYGVGEAASGAAMLSILGDVIDEIVPLARSAEITYRRPGLGALTATAAVDEPPDLIRARFDERGRVDFAIAARVEKRTGQARRRRDRALACPSRVSVDEWPARVTPAPWTCPGYGCRHPSLHPLLFWRARRGSSARGQQAWGRET